MATSKWQAPGFQGEFDRAREDAFSNEGAPPPRKDDRDAPRTVVAVAPSSVSMRERRSAAAFAAWLASQRPRRG